MDQMFLESIEFFVPAVDGVRAVAVSPSLELAFSEVCKLVGLELIDYGSVLFRREGAVMRIEGHSKAWRAKAERSSVAR